MTSNSDFLKDYYAQRAKEQAELPAKLAAFREKLLALGIQSVGAEYSGSGDSGQIDGITHTPETVALSPMEGELENLLYATLEARHPGWEINDGSSGSFQWDIVKDVFEHRHESYYTESNTTEHEGYGE